MIEVFVRVLRDEEYYGGGGGRVETEMYVCKTSVV